MAVTRNQKIAASHKGGHALTLAGPGTGKTTTLIERCRLLLKSGVPLDALFVTTFTTKASTEIRERLKDALIDSKGKQIIDRDEILKKAWIGTFHSLCVRLLKRYPMEAGLPYDFEIISDDDQRQILYGLGIEWDEEDGNIVDNISRWKDAGVSPDKAMEEARTLGDKFTVTAAKGYRAYEKDRVENSRVDFSDMITLATHILRAGGAGARWFHGNFTHFVVDEFQDANHTQIEFLKAALGTHGTLWAVGDENQSLYEWRGSTPRYCLNFSKIFPRAKVYALDESFRCSPQIIKMSSRLIRRNSGRYDREMKPARAAVKGEFVLYKPFADGDAEAEWIAIQLRKHMDAGGDISRAAVLFRTTGISNFLQRHLEKRGVPFKLMGAGSFWKLPEVNLFILATAKITGDDRFDLKSGFGRTKAGFKTRSFAEELKGESVRAFAAPLSRLLYEFRPRNLDPERKASWLTSVEAVLNILLDLDNAKAFLDLAHARQNSEEGERKDRVMLSTLHSAKGLEWDMVFVAGVEDDVLPHARSTNLEEERRLFYVGMTRARYQLVVSYAKYRHDKAKKPSRFLQESVLSPSDNVGPFKWISPETADEADKDKKQGSAAHPPSSKDNRKAPTKSGGRKVYRHKGGRSLIPPDERGQ